MKQIPKEKKVICRNLRSYFRINRERLKEMTTFLTAAVVLNCIFRVHINHTTNLSRRPSQILSSVSSVLRFVAVIFLAKHRTRFSSQPLLHRPLVPSTADV